MGALSKGCGTCKKRKVKCDETHPRCTRCCNAGIECTGFAPRLRFVDEQPRIRRSMAISHAQFHEFSTITGNSHLLFDPARRRRSQSLQTPLCLADALPVIAFKDDIFMSYLLFKLFDRGSQPALDATGGTRCGISTDWISELANTSQRPRQKSWDALAAVVFGQAHSSQYAVSNGVRLYGQALSELRYRLSNSEDWCSDTTLASMTAFYMYEMLVSKTERGWMHHANGLGWLLERRGPRQQQTLSAKSIFLDHRILLVAKSIISRQSTFLRDPEWKTTPWEDEPASKTDIDQLVDIGTDIAEYVAKFCEYSNNKSGNEIEYSRLREYVASSLGELNTWWRQWEASHAQPATEVASPQGTDEPLFSTLLEYDEPWTAFTICNYDAMRILLLQLWDALQLTPGATPKITQGVVLDEPNSTTLLGITSNTTGLACEILRSLKYAYGMSRRFIFTCSFLFIQEVANGCFALGSKEAIWIARHGWADARNPENVEDANILRKLPPLGQIRAADIRRSS